MSFLLTGVTFKTAVQRSRCAAVVCVKEGLAGPAKPSSFSRSFAGDSPITVVGLPSEEWCKAKVLFSLKDKVKCPGQDIFFYHVIAVIEIIEIKIRRMSCRKFISFVFLSFFFLAVLVIF